jgi:hypothetical protein
MCNAVHERVRWKNLLAMHLLKRNYCLLVPCNYILMVMGVPSYHYNCLIVSPAKAKCLGRGAACPKAIDSCVSDEQSIHY